MADDDLDEPMNDDLDAGSEGGGKKGGKKKLLVIVLPLLLLIGGGAGAYFMGLADPILAMFGGGGETAEAEQPAQEQRANEIGVFYEVPEMLVNLNSGGRRKEFLKIRVALELNAQEDVPRIEQVIDRIIDNFTVYLRELRQEDLQGSEGIYRLREELLIRVNAATRPTRVRDVLFKEMLVQ
ncbi:MAG: flagellar basal body-associated FliL family protein [Rhodospirillales bacterium]